MSSEGMANYRDLAADNFKVLQLGKFYPILGGVEKVMYSLMEGLSDRGVRCDMLCAAHPDSATPKAGTASAAQGTPTTSDTLAGDTTAATQATATADVTQGTPTTNATLAGATLDATQGTPTTSDTLAGDTTVATQATATADVTQGTATADAAQGTATTSAAQRTPTTSATLAGSAADATQAKATAAATQAKATAAATQGTATTSAALAGSAADATQESPTTSATLAGDTTAATQETATQETATLETATLETAHPTTPTLPGTLPGTLPLNPNANLVCTKTWLKFAGTMISPSMISKLKRICDGYDIIHVHHPDPMACLALRLSGYRGKVVLHWHSDIIKQHNLLKLYKPLQKWLLRRSDLILCTSEPYMKGSEYLRPWLDKCKVLPIGIKPLKADEARAKTVRERYEGKKLVFSLGRLVPYKGFEYLIDAFSLLPDNYRLVIGGVGPMEDSLKQRVKKLRLQERIVFPGYLTDEEAAAHFAACDLFCFSSIYKTEAFGIVQLEAMSMAKPIVATRIPGSGVDWVNAHGISGLNVPIANPAALADAILQVTGRPEDAARFSKGALDRYETTFTFDKMIDDALSIYRTLMDKR